MRISDWSSDVCSSDLLAVPVRDRDGNILAALNVATFSHAHSREYLMEKYLPDLRAAAGQLERAISPPERNLRLAGDYHQSIASRRDHLASLHPGSPVRIRDFFPPHPLPRRHYPQSAPGLPLDLPRSHRTCGSWSLDLN